MVRGFAEGTVPPSVKADEIGEGVVGRGAPDPREGDDPRRSRDTYIGLLIHRACFSSTGEGTLQHMRDEHSTDTAEGLRPGSSRGFVLFGMILLTGLIAMDQTIVATAVPTIVRSLGGFTQFPWVFSAYLLTLAVTIPLYGKLADHFGRKRLILFGSVVFILGSVFAGLASSMTVLIIFRAVQGIGAGAIRPLTVTVIGDLYTVEERAKIQGLVASVWGVSSVVAPIVGGLFSQYLTWRWIFFVNVPLGIVAISIVALRFHERMAHRDTAVDFAGSGLLVAGIGALVLALLQAGGDWAWTSLQTLGTGGAGLLILVAFVLWERRAKNPIFPLWVFGSRQLTGAVLATLVVGLITLGMVAYIPTLAQGVFRASPVVAGSILGLMSIGWPLASSFAGRIYLKIGFRNTGLIGALFILASTLVCLLVSTRSSILLLAVGSFGLGVGLGLVTTPMIVGAQSVVDWGRRGAVTGAVTFGQMFGGTLSTAIFGSLFNGSLSRSLAAAPTSLAGQIPTPDRAASLLEQGGAAPALVHFLQGGLLGAVHQVFVGLLVAGVAGAVILLAMPRVFSFIEQGKPGAPERA